MFIIFNLIEEALDSLDQFSSKDLVQIRGQNRIISLYSMKNGILEESSRNLSHGIGIRILSNGAWGFTRTNITDFQNIQSSIVAAQKLAKAASNHQTTKIQLPRSPSINDSVKSKCQKPIENFSQDEIVKLLRSISSGLFGYLPELKNANLNLLGLTDKKFFLSSEGSKIQEEFTKIQLKIDLLLKKHDSRIPFSETYGHTGGMELFDRNQPDFMVENLVREVKSLLEAESCPAGMFKVIIQPSLCATLLHEAIGHPLEADLAMAGGGFNEALIGRTVSSELVTIYDSGLIEHGLGYFTYDDEGIKCVPTTLIENGILKSYMHDRTSASMMGTEPTGNAHAWDFSVSPMIRQTNIGLKAGDYSLEELIEDIRHGFILDGTFGGMANSNGDFTFGFQRAFQINQGNIEKVHLGANVSGNAIDVFKTIDGVSNKSILRPGACGKGQFAIQGRIVPAIRCNILIGGKGGI